MLIHESCFIYLSYIIFHSSVGKYLGGFHVFAVSSSAAVIIFGHISLCPCASFSGKNVEGDMLVCRVLDSLSQPAFSRLTPQELGPGALQGPDCPLELISSWHELVLPLALRGGTGWVDGGACSWHRATGACKGAGAVWGVRGLPKVTQKGLSGP